MAKYGKLNIQLDIGPEQADNCHGRHGKDMIVLHETVSPDYPGLKDIKSISAYLDEKDYGIHCITDADGNVAVAKGQMNCVFYHTASNGSKGNGLVNSRGIGIELVSRVMLESKVNIIRFRKWRARKRQINRTARLIAVIAKREKIPIRWSNGDRPGVTTHWSVTHTFGVPGGHVDCWPKHMGGYFPALEVIYKARYWYGLWYG
jgi:hypothetical protein